MVLNDIGKIANRYWTEIPKHFPNVVLQEHIVMPNHIHGIIELKNNIAIIGNIPWDVPTETKSIRQTDTGFCFNYN